MFYMLNLYSIVLHNCNFTLMLLLLQLDALSSCHGFLFFSPNSSWQWNTRLCYVKIYGKQRATLTVSGSVIFWDRVPGLTQCVPAAVCSWEFFFSKCREHFIMVQYVTGFGEAIPYCTLKLQMAKKQGAHN